MTVSLVIPALNEENYLGECLDSVIKNASGRFCEVIVVDNGSTDRTSAIALQRSGVRLLYEATKGVTYARQRGLEAARGSLVAFIDADARLPTGWPDIAEQAFAMRPDLVCLSGPYRYHDGSWPQRWLLNLISLFATLLGYRMFGYMLVGGNFIAKKKALEEIGGFDRTIDFYGEDTDLGRRLAQQGTALFSGRLFIYTSGRRFYAEGILRSNATYLVNFLWIILFHRPYSTSHNDIRLYQE